MSAARDHACPVCDHRLGATVLEVASVPALANALWPDAESARAAPRGDIELRICDECGLLTNVAFEPTRATYGPAYENSLHFSATFSDYARGLAERLISTYRVRDEVVVDIGCGKGEFLALVCELGSNRGIGYDPSYEGPLELPAGDGSMRFVRERYPAGGEAGSAALICCRHVLEHQLQPAELLLRLADALDGGRVVVYLEVPDAAYMLERDAVWDVIYEHPQYFSAAPLKVLCRATGLEPMVVESTYGGQFLALDAAWPASGSSSGDRYGVPTHWSRSAVRFGERFAAAIESWQERLVELRRSGARVALWGAGSKGISFLNLVPAASEIEQVVDVNPRKHGLHVPGTAHRISNPEELAGTSLDAVVVLNPLYRSEILARLADMEVDVDALVA